MSIVVYSRSNCHYCVSAKNHLRTKNIKFTEVDLDDVQALTEFRNQYPDIRQVPQIVINGERIGGYLELLKYDLSSFIV
jgi:glutaredoxin 3